MRSKAKQNFISKRGQHRPVLSIAGHRATICEMTESLPRDGPFCLCGLFPSACVASVLFRVKVENARGKRATLKAVVEECMSFYFFNFKNLLGILSHIFFQINFQSYFFSPLHHIFYKIIPYGFKNSPYIKCILKALRTYRKRRAKFKLT